MRQWTLRVTELTNTLFLPQEITTSYKNTSLCVMLNPTTHYPYSNINLFQVNIVRRTQNL